MKYLYKNENNEIIEIEQPFGSSALATYNGKKVRRIITKLPKAVYKTKGFYTTDHDDPRTK